MNILIVIPARGGSKGIPRKNLRALVGKSLIEYSIKTALASQWKPDVVVSTDDGEIANITSQLGAGVIKRDASKAQDDTTLDPVIFDALTKASESSGEHYDIVVTLQPTSPLLKVSSLDSAISRLVDDTSIDTVISATEDTHLTWGIKQDRYVPNYRARVNRQFLPKTFKETGGFLITRAHLVTENNRIGNQVDLYLLSGGENIDIDTYEDWNLCEYHLKRKKILFVVSGNRTIGLGHVYNTLLIANNILNHQIEFLVDKESQLAFEKIALKNYAVHVQSEELIVDDIARLAPDVVINDRLDTCSDYVQAIKGLGIKTINFEDLGEGAHYADLVINAIYPEKEVLPKHYFGHEYFVLRDEFMLTPAKPIEEEVQSVLLTFGGVDPNNYTHKVIKSIYEYCVRNEITIQVVAGFGYEQFDSLTEFDAITLHKNTSSMAQLVSEADLVFTSAGRTTYEVASLSVPAIVLAQNEREMTHFFATAEHGFLNLGLGYDLKEQDILKAFVNLVENYESRKYMSSLMSKADLKHGRQRVLKLINDIVELA